MISTTSLGGATGGLEGEAFLDGLRGEAKLIEIIGSQFNKTSIKKINLHIFVQGGLFGTAFSRIGWFRRGSSRIDIRSGIRIVDEL